MLNGDKKLQSLYLPYRSRLNIFCDFQGGADVFREDSRSKTKFSVVSSLNYVIDLLKLENALNWSENLQIQFSII